MNLLTKPLATEWGIGFTIAFLVAFMISERYRPQQTSASAEHLEQFNLEEADEITGESLGLKHTNRKLIVIRSSQQLDLLDKVLTEIDPDKTDVVLMVTKTIPGAVTHVLSPKLNRYDQELMTVVVERAEKIGKHVTPLVVPTNNRIHAILRTAQEVGAQEIILAADQRGGIGRLRELLVSYWQRLEPKPSGSITVRLIGQQGQETIQLEAGSRQSA